jgi:glycosyltransferase involved in cell wall biosynthesis
MVVHLLLNLDRDRYDAHAVSLYPPVTSDLPRMLTGAGIPMSYLGKGSGFDPRIFARFDKLVRQFRPHVVHTHLNALFYAAPSAKLHQVPHFYTAQNLVPLLVPRSLRWFYRICFEHWVHVVPVADAVARDLRDNFRLPRLTTIPNAIPVERYAHPRVSREQWRAREGFATEDVLFVCAARLSPQKNHALLLEAFAAGPVRHPSAHLLLAGDGELRNELMRQAAASGIADRVSFLGVRDDVPELLVASDIFVLASGTEGNPLSVMEAMAAGLPPICTDAGGVKELMEPGFDGFLIQPGDFRSLSEHMVRLLGDPTLRVTVGRRAAQRARKHFDVSALAQAYDRLYTSQLGRPGPRATVAAGVSQP